MIIVGCIVPALCEEFAPGAMCPLAIQAKNVAFVDVGGGSQERFALVDFVLSNRYHN